MLYDSLGTYPYPHKEKLMNRRTLDKLLAAGGVVVTAGLLVAAALLSWAHSFVDDQVHSQLSAQQIVSARAASCWPSDCAKVTPSAPYT